MKSRSNRVPQCAPVLPASSVLQASFVIPGLTRDPWIADQVRNDTGVRNDAGVTNDTGVRNYRWYRNARRYLGYGL